MASDQQQSVLPANSDPSDADDPIGVLHARRAALYEQYGGDVARMLADMAKRAAEVLPPQSAPAADHHSDADR